MSDEETTSGVVQTAKNRNSVESTPLPAIISANSSQHASPSNGEAHHAGSFYLPIKPFLTIDQQIAHLEEIGIAVNNEHFARQALLDCNYYRLRAYWMTFEHDGKIAPGTTFEDVWSIYVFDEELRQWLWDAIAPFEIKMRTVFAYWLAEACGPMAYCEPEHFVNAKVHAQTMEAFDKEVNRAKRDQVPCVCHNLRKYGKLPVWAAVEVMTMGQLSYLYGNLCNCAEKPLEERAVKKMAQEFGLRPAVLKSWLQHLCAVRNTCGHHGRFYNRVMRIRPKMLARERQWAGNKEFPTFLVLKDIYEVVWPELWTNKAAELAAIVVRHSGVDLRPMGFPEDWQDVLGVPLLEESTNGV